MPISTEKSFSRKRRRLDQSLVNGIAWTADQLLLGSYLGKETLGAYSFALTFAQVPVSEVGSLSGKVVPGVFSAVQNSRTQLTRYLLLLTEASSYVTVPATIGIALVAEDFVPLAIGPQWFEVILQLQILSIYMCTVAVTVLWSHILIWTGHARINMYMTFLALLMLTPAFYLGTKFGLAGVALAWTLVFPLTLIPVFWFIRQILHLRFARFLRCLGPALICTAVMAVAVITVRDFIAQDLSTGYRFAATVTSGVIGYCTCMLLFFRHRVANIVGIVRGAIRQSQA